MNFREITLDDYESLVDFWKKNYFVNEMDSKERFILFLDKNPQLSMLAEDENKIIGTALGSFDGRRGYLQKVVVDEKYRKKGIGLKLVEKVIHKLYSLGTTYIPISVEKENVHFYEKCGFKTTSQTPMNIELPNSTITNL